jgi:hypothetical protein
MGKKQKEWKFTQKRKESLKKAQKEHVILVKLGRLAKRK